MVKDLREMLGSDLAEWGLLHTLRDQTPFAVAVLILCFLFSLGILRIKDFLFFREKLLFLCVVKKTFFYYDNYLTFVSFFSVG